MWMKVLEAHSKTGWITAIIQDHWVQAKVYDEPSTYGVNNGRVSKIAVSKTNSRNPEKPFFEQLCFNYDRGLDFDKSPEGLIEKIITELESLPLLFPKENVEQTINEKKEDNSKKGRFNIE